MSPEKLNQRIVIILQILCLGKKSDAKEYILYDFIYYRIQDEAKLSE